MTSTPVQSDEELSDNDEVMKQDDDPSYVPDPEEIDVDANHDDIGFDDFDDRLLYVYESPKEVSTYCCAEDIATATVHSAEQHQS